MFQNREAELIYEVTYDSAIRIAHLEQEFLNLHSPEQTKGLYSLCLNVLKTTELYSLNWWIVGMWIKLKKMKERCYYYKHH